MTHPARLLPFDDLLAGLRTAKAEGSVAEVYGPEGLSLFCYTNRAVYDRLWNSFSLMARGLILDTDQKQVVATPFPKFFNAGEGEGTIPDEPFETFEKVDGSLIIIFYHGGRWKTATKGSLVSSQAAWAGDQLCDEDLSELVPGITYLAEAVYPENRIVVHYDEAGLVLLAAYDETGSELPYLDLIEVADRMNWRIAKRHSYASFREMIVAARAMTANEEGFVARFDSGLRLKVKGDEYRRIHSLISRCTPLAMWEAMQAGDDMVAVRRDLPEEFWRDFDAITAALTEKIAVIVAATANEADRLKDSSDKEIGLQLKSLPYLVQPFIFPFRKSGGNLMTGRTRDALFRAIRPMGNFLDGYTPSYAMARVVEEAA